MHEFESFVYLDVEKTGSTFISRLLNKFSREPALRQMHHHPMDGDFDPKKFYFISVRDPMDAYLSLYSFGCQQEGKVFARLRKHGHEALYDRGAEGFGDWLQFVLKPKHAFFLGDRYDHVAEGDVAKVLGFQSYRYLRLAIPDAEELLAACQSEDDIRAVYEAHKMPKFVIRHENFVEDLCKLLRGPLAYAIRDVDAAVEFARSTEPANTSVRIDKGDETFKIKRRLREKLKEREWLLPELFGY